MVAVERVAPVVRVNGFDLLPGRHVARVDSVNVRMYLDRFHAFVAADEVAVECGDDAAVGHHAVHVEDEGFGADYIFFEVSHMLLLMIE